MAEKKLEEQLVEAGKRLQTPPSDLDELLPILYQVENCLLSVEQSPSKSVLTALEPSRDALVARELLTHSDKDVKVAVASCISEITRITAPDAPYSDDLMKEIFQVIVGSFEDLFEMSSPSYSKRVSILETVAKVRSCVVMLDLECDDLILKMFQYFLETIRENHPDNVFTSMETIMTLVLEESEDISSELLSCLLSSVKKEKQDVSPVAYKLGERVIIKCAAKMKPYLLDKVQSRGFSLESYSKLIATICQVTSDAGELNDINSPGNQLAEEIKLSERSGSDETPPVIEKVESEDPEVDPAVSKVPITVTTNGTVQIGDELISPKKRPGHSRRKMKSKKPVTTSRAEPDQATKIRRNQKSSSLIPSAESTDHSRINITEEAEPMDRKKGVIKEIDNSSASEALIKVSSPSSDREKKTELSSPTESHNQLVSNAAHQSTEHEAPAAEAHPKRGRALGKKKATGVNVEPAQPAQPATPLELTGSVMGGQIEDQVQETPDLKLKESEGTSNSEFKTLKDASVNVSSGDINEDETLPSIGRKSKKEFPARKQEAKTKRRKGSTADLKLKEFEGTSDSEFKTLKDSSKSVSSVDRDEDKTKERKGTTADLKLKESKDKSDSEFETPKESSKNVSSGDIDEDEILPSTGRKSKKEFPAEKQEAKTKQRKGTLVAEKNRTNSSEKSALKASTSDQIPFEGTPKTKLKRKRGAVTEEESEIESGEKLVSSRVKVWWPDDQMFYKGAVVSYDPVKKKHEILYDDGDKEILLLKEERWELVKDDDVSDGEKAADIGNLAASSEISNKKGKQRDSSSTQGNVEGSSKRVGRGSAGKPKADSSKSGGKIKGSGSPKSSGKSEEVTTKLGNKSKDETPLVKAKEQLKVGDKSKDDSPKSGSRTKVGATPKSGTKSRDEPAKSGRKPSSNGGSSAKAKSGISSKALRSGNSAKEKSSPAEVVENETKSGTKRRRKA